MNVHYCPTCGRGFWARESIDKLEKLPTHDNLARLPCPGSREAVIVVRPDTPAPPLDPERYANELTITEDVTFGLDDLL